MQLLPHISKFYCGGTDKKPGFTKKLSLSSVCFLIRRNLDHPHYPLVDFKGERELLEQIGLHRQNQLMVSKTCSTFLGELVTRLSHFK